MNVPRVDHGLHVAWSESGELIGIGLTESAAVRQAKVALEGAHGAILTVAAVHLVQIGAPARLGRIKVASPPAIRIKETKTEEDLKDLLYRCVGRKMTEEELLERKRLEDQVRLEAAGGTAP